MTIHSQDHMSLSITRAPDSSVDYVQIEGDVDLADADALGLAARALIEDDASVIYVDLGGVTFMGSTLVDFLEQIAAANGDACRPVILCRPTPMARLVIHVTGLDLLAIGRPDLPPLWPDVSASEPAAASETPPGRRA